MYRAIATREAPLPGTDDTWSGWTDGDLNEFARIILSGQGLDPSTDAAEAVHANDDREIIAHFGEGIRHQRCLGGMARIARFLRGDTVAGTTVFECYKALDEAVAAFRAFSTSRRDANKQDPWMTAGGGDRVLPIVLSTFTAPSEKPLVTPSDTDPRAWPWEAIANHYMTNLRDERVSLLIPGFQGGNTLDADSFLDLVKRGVHFRDIAAGLSHGAFTHQMQWWMVLRAGFLSRPWQVLAAIGMTRTTQPWLDERGYGAKQDDSFTTMWDALFDRDTGFRRGMTRPPDANWFRVGADSLDFRSPHVAHALLVPLATHPALTAAPTANRERMVTLAPSLSRELDRYVAAQIALGELQGSIDNKQSAHTPYLLSKTGRKTMKRLMFGNRATTEDEERFIWGISGIVRIADIRRGAFGALPKGTRLTR